MSTIQIGKDWRIEGDEHQWTVQRWTKRKKPRRGAAKARHGENGEWRGVSYHRTIEAACASLRGRVARTCDADTVEGIREALSGLDDDFRAAGL